MILVDKLGFIPHPGTGSRSVKGALYRIGGRCAGPGYHQMDEKIISRCDFVFCTLRNPFDWWASWYYRVGAAKQEKDFDDWLSFTTSSRALIGPGDFLYYGYPHSNLVMKFENMQGDFDRIMEAAGYEPIKLGHVGETKDRVPGYRHLYSNVSRRLIEEKYAEQLEWGEYEF